MGEILQFRPKKSEIAAKSDILVQKTRFFSYFALKGVLSATWTALVDRLVNWGSIAIFTILYGIILSYVYIYVRIVVYYRDYHGRYS